MAAILSPPQCVKGINELAFFSLTKQWTQGIDVKTCVIVTLFPNFFGKLQRKLPVCKCNIFASPNVKLSTKVKHEHLKWK